MPSAPRPRKRGRPRKPKRDHSVTLTLTLPNAAFRRHLQRVAKGNRFKSPSAFMVALLREHYEGFETLHLSSPPPRQSGQ